MHPKQGVSPVRLERALRAVHGLVEPWLDHYDELLYPASPNHRNESA